MSTSAIPSYDVTSRNSSESKTAAWSDNSLASAGIRKLLAETPPSYKPVVLTPYSA